MTGARNVCKGEENVFYPPTGAGRGRGMDVDFLSSQFLTLFHPASSLYVSRDELYLDTKYRILIAEQERNTSWANISQEP